MVWLCWDASALLKRYAPEPGSETVNAFFEGVLPDCAMVGALLGYAETYAVVLRRYNNREMSAASFATAVCALQSEVLDHEDFLLLEAESVAVLSSIALVRALNLNTSDALILTLSFRFQASRLAGGVPCLLIAADKRLVRAAEAEGLCSLNPATVSPADLPTVLSDLY